MRKRLALFTALLLTFSFAAGCESLTAPRTDTDTDKEEPHEPGGDDDSAALPVSLNFA